MIEFSVFSLVYTHLIFKRNQDRIFHILGNENAGYDETWCAIKMLQHVYIYQLNWLNNCNAREQVFFFPVFKDHLVSSLASKALGGKVDCFYIFVRHQKLSMV